MSVFVQISDFSNGLYKIPTNIHTQGDLQSYIDQHEKSFIYKTFGIVMGEEIYGNPLLFTELQEEFIEDIEGCFTESKGLKFGLLGVIYFYYMRDQYVKAVNGGATRAISEVSENKSSTSLDIYTRYNNAIYTLKAIQYKCESDETLYPDYNGQKLNLILPF